MNENYLNMTVDTEDAKRTIDFCIQAIPNVTDGELSLGIIAKDETDNEQLENLRTHADMKLKEHGYDTWEAEWREELLSGYFPDKEKEVQLKLYASKD